MNIESVMTFFSALFPYLYVSYKTLKYNIWFAIVTYWLQKSFLQRHITNLQFEQSQ